MPLPYETVDEIRERILAIRALEYDDGDGTRVLDTSRGSLTWCEAQAEALLVHDLQVQVNDKGENILPDRATGTLLDRHAALWLGPDNDRLPAHAWYGTWTFENQTSGSLDLPADTEVLCADGTSYKTIAVATIGALASLDVACRSITLGTVANKAVGTVGMLSSPPLGFSAQATLAAVDTEGEDAEIDTELQVRNAERLREMPGGGNCAHYRFRAKATDGAVAEVFVYPIWDGKGTTTIVPLGEPAADSDDGETHRILADSVRIELQDALDADVTPDAVGAEATVVLPTAVRGTIDIDVEPEQGYEPDWIGTLTEDGAETSTTTKVYTTVDPTTVGLAHGHRVVCMVVVGGNQTNEERTVDVVGPGNCFTVDTAFSSAPVDASTVRPGGPLWAPIRAAMLGALDALGPSGCTTPDITERDPAPDASFHPELNVAAVLAAAQTTTGVRDVAVNLPAADVVNNVAPGTPPFLLQLGLFICRWV
jgi:uncharacterized phage protein gp47/JayE